MKSQMESRGPIERRYRSMGDVEEEASYRDRPAIGKELASAAINASAAA